MKKRVSLLAFILVLILVSIVLFILPSFLQPLVPTPQPKVEEYLHFTSNYQQAVETKVYLVNSMLFYGAYNQSFIRSSATGYYLIKQGDPCVIINGTIRNDYDNNFYFCRVLIAGIIRAISLWLQFVAPRISNFLDFFHFLQINISHSQTTY